MKYLVLTDDAGIHSDATYCLMAGYAGPAKMWRKLGAAWRKVHKAHGLREDTVFHSRVFFNRDLVTDPRKNPYYGWSDQKANDYLGDLLKVISGQRRLTRIGSGIKMDDFNCYTYAEQCALAGHIPTPSTRKSRDPVAYHVVFRLMINAVAQYTEQDARLHFVCSYQEEYRQRALDAYLMTQELGEGGWEHKLKGIEFAKPSDQPGLQVGDLLAWQWHNFLTRTARGQGISRQNQSAIDILNKKPGFDIIWNRDDMEAWINRSVTPEDREYLRGLTPEKRDELAAAQILWRERLAKFRRSSSA